MNKTHKAEDSAENTLKLLLVARCRLFITFSPYFSQVLMITNVAAVRKEELKLPVQQPAPPHATAQFFDNNSA